jgi:hypothetical protein
MDARRLPLKDRFWLLVRKSDSCWEWTGLRCVKGYGLCTVKCRRAFSHRVSWELAHGPIPEGLCVLHSCDNPACVRPDHLFLGTRKDNSDDKVAKGRQAKGKRAHKKLSHEKAQLIREMRSKGMTYREIGQRFRVSTWSVWLAANGKTYS